MTILLEGCSLVFDLKALETKYPGGVVAFLWGWDNGSWCSDQFVGRLSYYSHSEAVFCASSLGDQGIHVGKKYAEDIAIVMQGQRPLLPCLWAEVQIVGDRFCTCTHMDGAVENIKLPRYFRRDLSLAHYATLDSASLKKSVIPIGRRGKSTFYKDMQSDRAFPGPGQLSRH